MLDAWQWPIMAIFDSHRYYIVGVFVIGNGFDWLDWDKLERVPVCRELFCYFCSRVALNMLRNPIWSSHRKQFKLFGNGWGVPAFIDMSLPINGRFPYEWWSFGGGWGVPSFMEIVLLRNTKGVAAFMTQHVLISHEWCELRLQTSSASISWLRKCCEVVRMVME